MIDGVEEAMAELISTLKKISQILNRPTRTEPADSKPPLLNQNNSRLRKASVARRRRMNCLSNRMSRPHIIIASNVAEIHCDKKGISKAF